MRTPVVFSKASGSRTEFAALPFLGIAVLLCVGRMVSAGTDPADPRAPLRIAVMHHADAVVTYVSDLDLLRRQFPGLRGEFQLLPKGVRQEVDLAASYQPPAVVLEKGTAVAQSLRIRISGAGKLIHEKEYPLGKPLTSEVSVALTGRKAALEAGNWKEAEPDAELRALANLPASEKQRPAPVVLPEIKQPDLAKLPAEILRRAERSLDLKAITYPVVCDANYASRQRQHRPDAPDRASRRPRPA